MPASVYVIYLKYNFPVNIVPVPLPSQVNKYCFPILFRMAVFLLVIN